MLGLAKILTVFGTATLISLTSSGQLGKSISVGEKCPDIALTNIANYPHSEIRLSELKGKLIILDFGTTSCHPCRDALVVLDSLKKSFGEKIQPFFITPEKELRVKAFLENDGIGKKINLPIVQNDTVVKKYFEHEFIPHEVWIDQDGIVVAITDHEYINAENITSILKNEKINWPIKHEEIYDYEQRLLVLNDNNIPKGNFEQPIYSYSVLTGYMDGVGSRYVKKIDSIENTIRISVINEPIIKLYLWAYDKASTTFSRKRILLEVKDRSLFNYDSIKGYSAEWHIKNSYCYEGVFPLGVSNAARTKKMLADLDIALGLNGRMEKREVECWVLSRKGIVKGLKTKPQEDSLLRQDAESGFLSLGSLLYMLERKEGNPPIIDETFLSNDEINKYLKIKRSALGNIKELNRFLSQFGLTVKEEVRSIELLVITEKGFNHEN